MSVTAVLSSDSIATELLFPVVASVGTSKFGPALLDMLERQFGTIELFAHATELEGSSAFLPCNVVCASRRGGVEERAESYLRTAFGLDGFWRHLAGISRGQLIFSRCNLSSPAGDQHRMLMAEKGGLDERLSIGYHGAHLIILNLYRPAGEATNRTGVEALQQVAQTLMSLVGTHHSSPPIGRDHRTIPPCEDVERMLVELRPDLTPREREVCARTVIGMTAYGISSDLGISISTVTTYRRRAYARMGICSAHELLGAMLKGRASGYGSAPLSALTPSPSGKELRAQ